MTKEIKKLVEEGFKFFVKDGSCEKIIKPYKVGHYAKVYAEKNNYIVEDENGNILHDFTIKEVESEQVNIPESFLKSEDEIVATEVTDEYNSGDDCDCECEDPESEEMNSNASYRQMIDFFLTDLLKVAEYSNIDGGYLTATINDRVTRIISKTEVGSIISSVMDENVDRSPDEVANIVFDKIEEIKNKKIEERENTRSPIEEAENPVTSIPAADIKVTQKKSWFQKFLDLFR